MREEEDATWQEGAGWVSPTTWTGEPKPVHTHQIGSVGWGSFPGSPSIIDEQRRIQETLLKHSIAQEEIDRQKKSVYPPWVDAPLPSPAPSAAPVQKYEWFILGDTPARVEQNQRKSVFVGIATSEEEARDLLRKDLTELVKWGEVKFLPLDLLGKTLDDLLCYSIPRGPDPDTLVSVITVNVLDKYVWDIFKIPLNKYTPLVI